MLGKLIKYEIQATARTFLPIYGAVILLSIINKLAYMIPTYGHNWNYAIEQLMNLPAVLSTALYIVLLIALFILTYAVMIVRFYKNLLGSEGYLMFTLPVAPWMNIICKLIVSVIWMVLSFVVAVLSILVLAFNTEVAREIIFHWPLLLAELQRGFQEFLRIDLALFFMEMGCVLFVSSLTFMLRVFAAISLGQLMNSHRVLTSVGIYIGLGVVENSVSSVLSIFVIVPFATMSDALLSGVMPNHYINTVMLLSIGISAFFACVYYAVSHFVLSKKLNLE